VIVFASMKFGVANGRAEQRLDQPGDPEKLREIRGMAIGNALAVCRKRVLVQPYPSSEGDVRAGVPGDARVASQVTLVFGTRLEKT
jgi:hypothetical protein